MKMMAGFLRKTSLLVQVRFALAAFPTHQSLHFPSRQFYPLSSSSTSNSISISTSAESLSFTMSYLIQSCGLPHKDALSASKSICLKTPEKPDSILAFFNCHGFSKSQTSKIVKSKPGLLLTSDPEKTLLPKLGFFYSKGVSRPDVATIVVSNPAILNRSLENQLIPSFNFLRDFFHSDETAISVVKRLPRILLFDLHSYVASNINALREFEVPKSNIAGLLKNQPRAFMVNPNRFREILEKVKEMGFNPSQMRFILATQAMRAVGKSTWERKTNLFKRWGCSEGVIQSAFMKFPRCMMSSEDKIMATMDFLVNKMGRDSSLIAHWPVLISLSLEKRIIPRYSIVQILLSKGLINKEFSLATLFGPSEKMFLHRFVNCFGEEAPQLMKLYQENINLSKRRDRLQDGSGSCKMSTL